MRQRFEATMNARLIRTLSALAVVVIFAAGCATPQPKPPQQPAIVNKWSPIEIQFTASGSYSSPFQDVELRVTFFAPDGERFTVPGFWNGGRDWRVRFAPNLAGTWSYQSICSVTNDMGLHGRTGDFLCTAPRGESRFTKHGPVRIARDGRHLIHDDLTPFLWVGDTAWNGALLSTPDDWDLYARTRNEQGFDAVQWVATQWRASPQGDLNDQPAFTGRDKIQPNLAFFNRLDRKADQLANRGLLNIPVLLWAINGGGDPRVNPGVSLPEDQAIKLARYMVARWQALPVVWILAGDGNYNGQNAERWKRIGRGVFGDIYHAPTMLHPGGQQWNLPDFQNEDWLDMIGYQSGHGDNDAAWKWIYDGPPSRDWKIEPPRPFINLEPCYENHLGYQSHKPHPPEHVRRAMYWSLLNAPTAGVSYGGHGVWGWDDGTKSPTDHAGTGTPLPWKEALKMPGAEQVRYLKQFFDGIDFWRLRPAPQMLTKQPGDQSPERYVAIAKSVEGDFAVAYIPSDRMIEVKLDQLPTRPQINWMNPRDGKRTPAVGVVTEGALQLPTPAEGDWVLLIRAGS